MNGADAFVAVAAVGSIPPGHSAAFKVNDQSVVIFNHDGELFAVDNRCPHQGAPLLGAPVLKGGKVRCMLHGWFFRLRGCEEDDELKRYPLRIKDGQIWICARAFPEDHVVDGLQAG